MPDILIKNLSDRVVPFTPNNSSVLNAIHSDFIDWMHTCGAKGKCTTCKMKVVNGMENISAHSENEQKYLAKGRLRNDERLACQCSITGDIAIEVCPENKLPHMKYSY
jgi:2Fe-2S ferredoxin